MILFLVRRTLVRTRCIISLTHSSKSKEIKQKHLLIEHSEKFGQFRVNSVAFRPKNSSCAPAACAWRAIAREQKIVPNQAYHHRKIQKKCHPISQNHSFDIFERQLSGGDKNGHGIDRRVKVLQRHQNWAFLPYFAF